MRLTLNLRVCGFVAYTYTYKKIVQSGIKNEPAKIATTIEKKLAFFNIKYNIMYEKRKRNIYAVMTQIIAAPRLCFVCTVYVAFC